MILKEKVSWKIEWFWREIFASFSYVVDVTYAWNMWCDICYDLLRMKTELWGKTYENGHEVGLNSKFFVLKKVEKFLFIHFRVVGSILTFFIG
jgi:hypothetical protein